MENRTTGIHFASSSVLAEVDQVQARFVRQLDLSDESAFMEFNLAPLTVNRDIAILGVIHRAAVRAGPAQLWKFFRVDLALLRREPRARATQRHSMQLIE